MKNNNFEVIYCLGLQISELSKGMFVCLFVCLFVGDACAVHLLQELNTAKKTVGSSTAALS